MGKSHGLIISLQWHLNLMFCEAIFSLLPWYSGSYATTNIQNFPLRDQEVKEVFVNQSVTTHKLDQFYDQKQDPNQSLCLPPKQYEDLGPQSVKCLI